MNLNRREKGDGDNENKIGSSGAEQFMLSQRKPRRTFKQCAVDHFCDYCSTTGIHGFSYLGQHRTLVEIIVWTILIILSVCASAYMINEIYQKYLDTPIIISIASRRRLTHTIPFPAVTICPTTKFHKNCFNYETVAEKIRTAASITEEEGRYYDYVKYICPSLDGDFREPNQKTFTEDIIGFLDKCKAASIYSCVYGPLDCTDYWKPVLTEEGICYTFNMLGRNEIFREGIKQYGDLLNIVNESDWNAETASYTSTSPEDNYPIPGLLTGLDNAFTVIMAEPKHSSDNNCNSDVKGYKVMLHLPVKYPTLTDDFFYMPLDKMVMAKIEPSMTLTSDSVKAYAYDKRVCYFPSERELSIFKVYTQSNCLMECANIINQGKCSCIDFHMARQSDVSICGPAQYNCSRSSKDASLIVNMMNLMVGAESNEQFRDSLLNRNEDIAEDNEVNETQIEEMLEMALKCDCLPTCNDISYDVEVSPYEYNPYVLVEKRAANSSFLNSVVWIMFILLSLSASMYMISEIYQQYLTSPIIISLASKRTLVHKIPFPAVTICSNTRLKNSCSSYGSIGGKIELNKTITEVEEKYHDYVKYICSDSVGNFLRPNQSEFTEDIFEFLNQCSAASVASCTYGIKDCTDNWVPILTEEGLCYTFNMLNRSDMFQEEVVQYGNFLEVAEESTWDGQTGTYNSPEVSLEDYPLRNFLIGLEGSFTVILSETKESSNSVCNSDVQGYKVMLHLPARMPLPTEDFFYMPRGKMLIGRIKPSMIITPDSIKAYDHSKRVCYFPSEKRLSIFKVYTQVNCLKECVILTTLGMCDCLDYHMPRYKNESICGPAKYNCSQEAQGFMKYFNILSMLYGSEGDGTVKTEDLLPQEEMKKILDVCDCLPECNDISYDVDASSYEYNWNTFAERPTVNPDFIESHHLTQLKLYFNSRYVHTLERNELYGLSEFISNFGGLIGLFTGFSILSAVEIFYFLSLRIWGNIKIYGQWSVPRNQEQTIVDTKL